MNPLHVRIEVTADPRPGKRGVAPAVGRTIVATQHLPGEFSERLFCRWVPLARVAATLSRLTARYPGAYIPPHPGSTDAR